MCDGHSLLDALLTSALPLLVFRGVLSLRAEKNRFWRLENETPFVWWRHRPTVKSVRFYHWYYIIRYTYVVERSVSMVNDFTLNCRHIFSHSVKEHPFCSRYRRNTLVALLLNFLCYFLYLESGLSWVVNAWTSDFKLFQENVNLDLSSGRGICAQF